MCRNRHRSEDLDAILAQGQGRGTHTGTREGTAGVWSVTVDAVLNGRDAHTLRYVLCYSVEVLELIILSFQFQ